MAGRIHQATLGNLPEILHRGKPVAVDFWAGWCAPCHVMAPILRDMADEFDGHVTFAKVDVDNNRDLAEQFRIVSIPTLVFFRKGKEWDRVSGVKSRQELRKILENLSS
ncbi:thioredoxin [archaeon RBG_16_50_20]|nr:MAG: thioredoxin [archaeon RBG_16_50_20]